MTVDELEKLRANAENTLGVWVIVIFDKDGWSVKKNGSHDEDLIDSTFEQAVAKLKEWATQPKPNNLAVTLPFEEVYRLANVASGELGRACREAIAPWQGIE